MDVAWVNVGLLRWFHLSFNCSSMSQFQWQFDKTTVEIMVWMINYIPLFHYDVIIYSCSNLTVGLGNL